MKRTYIFLWLAFLLALPLLTQDSFPSNPPPPAPTLEAQTFPPTNDAGNTPPPFNETVVPTKSSVELYLSIAVLAFGGIITLGLLYFLAQRTRSGTTEEFIDAVKYPIVVVIIVGGLFLVTAGYGNEQIAPIIGLMGTIAGYLMGRGKPGS